MFEKITSLPARGKVKIDNFLDEKWGWSSQQRQLTWHYFATLKDQVAAIIPISLLQIFVLAAFFQQSINEAGLQVMGLFLAIIGLSLFLDGLRVAIMPLAELVGTELPKKLPLPFVLLVAGFLGILVTYAEPAIASLSPLAKLIDPVRAPYLYFVMNQQKELMVFAIGAGVGVAAILAVLMFMRGWSLKPLIFGSLAPTVALACYMQWGNPNLSPVIGLAWDCGGVTTGPVTVPVLLALGIGVMQSKRQQRLAKAALEGSVAANAGQALEGFGIVTLASLWPVLAVELMGVIDGLIYDEAYVREQATQAAAAALTVVQSPIEKSPLKEVVYAIRSIMPLVVVLIFIVKVILRTSLPTCRFWVDPPPTDDSIRALKADDLQSHLSRASSAITKGLERQDTETSLTEGGSNDGSAHASTDAQKALAIAEATAAEEGEAGPAKRGCLAATGSWFRDNLPLIGGIAMTQIGMICFNEGLTYSFTKLGDQTGNTLPAAFLNLTDTTPPAPLFPKSPYYSYAGGLILVLVVIFILGVLATRAEPALNVLGRTVEKLSGGAFTSKMLINSVCVGVGIGLACGAAKILYSLPIIYFILAKYTIACILTVYSPAAVTAIAWDSAGVTTGPVTVPFVLSIGIGFSTAVNSPEGFGMLTIASVAPIISVLCTNLIKKPAKAAKKQLSLKARALGRSVTNMRAMRSMKRSPSTAMAAFALDAGGSTMTTPESSIRSGINYPGDASVRSGATFKSDDTAKTSTELGK